jgi:hypothetical protein
MALSFYDIIILVGSGGPVNTAAASGSTDVLDGLERTP